MTIVELHFTYEVDETAIDWADEPTDEDLVAIATTNLFDWLTDGNDPEIGVNAEVIRQ